MKNNTELSSQTPTELDLINYFHSGSKSPKDYKIGTENEKFLFHKESLSPLQYSDGPGIVDVFKILTDQFNWSPIFDGDNVIGFTSFDHSSWNSLIKISDDVLFFVRTSNSGSK